jgi:ankyrin repeat protein
MDTRTGPGALEAWRERLRASPGLSSRRLHRYGFTLLHQAVRAGRADLAELLVKEAGMDPDVGQSQNDAAPLHQVLPSPRRQMLHIYSYAGQAAFAGSEELVGALLALGANPARRTAGGWLPHHSASHGGHAGPLRLLLAAHHPPALFVPPFPASCKTALLVELGKAYVAAPADVPAAASGDASKQQAAQRLSHTVAPPST